MAPPYDYPHDPKAVAGGRTFKTLGDRRVMGNGPPSAHLLIHHWLGLSWLTVQMPRGSPVCGTRHHRKRTGDLVRLVFMGQVGMQPALASRQGKAT